MEPPNPAKERLKVDGTCVDLVATHRFRPDLPFHRALKVTQEKAAGVYLNGAVERCDLRHRFPNLFA